MGWKKVKKRKFFLVMNLCVSLRFCFMRWKRFDIFMLNYVSGLLMLLWFELIREVLLLSLRLLVLRLLILWFLSLRL